MIIVVPITLIVLGPIGTVLSNSVGAAIQAVMSVAAGLQCLFCLPVSVYGYAWAG